MISWLLWGLLFGWLRLRTKSIVPGFVLHGTFNFVVFLAVWASLGVVIKSLGE